jgi:hypothetical protein
LPGVFGVQISGVDFSKPMDGETERELLDLFHQNQLIVVSSAFRRFPPTELLETVAG